MIKSTVARCICLATATFLLGTAFSAAHASLVFNATGIYDESTTILHSNPGPNQVDTNAAPGAGSGTNVSSSDFAIHVATAFANDSGGVVTFDDDTEETTGVIYAFDAKYGANTLTTSLYLISSNTPASGTFSIVTGDDGNSVPISGAQYFGTNGNGGDFRFVFSKPLVEWGLTVLSRTANRTVNGLTITLDNGENYTFSGEAIAATTSNNNGPDDTFFGYRAPLGRSFQILDLEVSNFVRMDDMGFIVVPEPLTWYLVVIGCAALGLDRRLKSSRGRF